MTTRKTHRNAIKTWLWIFLTLILYYNLSCQYCSVLSITYSLHALLQEEETTLKMHGKSDGALFCFQSIPKSVEDHITEESFINNQRFFVFMQQDNHHHQQIANLFSKANQPFSSICIRLQSNPFNAITAWTFNEIFDCYHLCFVVCLRPILWDPFWCCLFSLSEIASWTLLDIDHLATLSRFLLMRAITLSA